MRWITIASISPPSHFIPNSNVCFVLSFFPPVIVELYITGIQKNYEHDVEGDQQKQRCRA